MTKFQILRRERTFLRSLIDRFFAVLDKADSEETIGFADKINRDDVCASLIENRSYYLDGIISIVCFNISYNKGRIFVQFTEE